MPRFLFFVFLLFVCPVFTTRLNREKIKELRARGLIGKSKQNSSASKVDVVMAAEAYEGEQEANATFASPEEMEDLNTVT
eukprot:CAMPEP_0169141780 /NCGR_PEP_ID=MMETSP1015-20121227/44539_1 /TAXON_ID=342587 /ORGANISM="Karlodinium micrum, Strain CCMP2283" /LENGTH=79 /DNA_ID=CAMNT_0009208283 /DNA_START=61 /DNA_END=297 /DNA_ORIENTATION=+